MIWGASRRTSTRPPARSRATIRSMTERERTTWIWVFATLIGLLWGAILAPYIYAWTTGP